VQIPTILKGGKPMRKSIAILAMLAAPLALAGCNKAPEATEEAAATEAAAPEAAATEAATDAAAAPAADAAAEAPAAAADGQSTSGGPQPVKQ
jgi:uncharacterized lipoprotein YajG